MKTCIACKVEKDLSQFYASSSHADGLSKICKACQKERNSAKYSKNAQKYKARAKEQRQLKGKEAISAYNRDYRRRNRDKLVAYSREWRNTHTANRTEESKTRNKQRQRQRYRNDAEHRERVKAQSIQYKKLNPEKAKSQAKKWRAGNLQRSRGLGAAWMAAYRKSPQGQQYYKDYRKKNWARIKEQNAAYNAKRYGSADAVPDKYLYWLHKWQDNRCCYCNAELSEHNKHLDHIVPLSRGGQNAPHNVYLTCCACNCSKSSKLLGLEWTPKPQVNNSNPLTSSFYATALERALMTKGYQAMNNNGVVTVGSLRVFVLSTFWIAGRFQDSIAVDSLREQHPDALFFFDYECSRRLDAVINVIAAKAGLASSVGARALEIACPSLDEAKEFMSLWHIQGFLGGSWYLGLKDKQGNWRAMASFQSRENAVELARLAFKDHVVGGLSRLVSAFRSEIALPVFTYADPRLGSGRGYQAIGFEPIGETRESYHYVNGTGLYNRLQYSKENMAAKLDWFSETCTERENAIANGLWRVIGARQKRYLLK